MKNKGTKQKQKKKGSENAFGCDLIEHLQSSGQDVPEVLKKCAEFIEEHGIVDGIYRLSGVTSNIQRLRQEFCSEPCPDLTKEVYLQDIHCVGSLCKLYFRELPNPLLTFELYSKFTELVSVQGDHERLVYVQRVVRELPPPHFRTLEYLTKHLSHLGTLSSQTNMHTRNLALVWAPNLLRSKSIESGTGNGDMAFQEVRIQQSVIEFILNHTDQIFSCGTVQLKPREGPGLKCGEKYATLPISSQCSPMKLMSLEEAQARSLSPNHPVHKERQRENSLPDTSTATLYHTVIDVTDSKRKFSGKSKRWKSIFNLGRSVESKGKLSRNGSVFIRAQGLTGKAALRPSRSMESLCSLPTDEDRTGNNGAAGGQGGIFLPEVKSRTLGSDYDLDEPDHNWDFKGKKTASGGRSSGSNQKNSPGASASPPKTLPEQLKVFKSDELSGYKPTSPKNRRMLYSGSHSSSSRPSFPGSFFPLESSPRHQRRAVNISEPFAVSVPLRVSAVISSNSTPCRGPAREKAATLKPCRETTSEQNIRDGKTDVEPRKTEESGCPEPMEGSSREAEVKARAGSPGEEPSPENTKESQERAPSAGEEVSTVGKLETQHATEECSDVHQVELKITEPEIQQLGDTFKPLFGSRSVFEVPKLTMDVKSKRSRSSPSLTLLCREQSSNTSSTDRLFSKPATKQPSESDILSSLHKTSEPSGPAGLMKGEKKEQREPETSDKDEPVFFKTSQPCSQKKSLDANKTKPEGPVSSGPESGEKNLPLNPHHDQRLFCDGAKKAAIPELESVQRLSVCLEERRDALELLNLDDDDGSELDLVEPWEDLSSTKQWVTSPLHSPDVEELFRQLSPFSGGSEETKTSSPPTANDRNTECPSGSVPQTSSSKSDVKWRYLSSASSRVNMTNTNATQPHTGKCSGTKQKNSMSSHRFYRQTSHEGSVPEKREDKGFPKHRPCSLNLDLGYRCIRDISNQQNHHLSEFSLSHRGLTSSSGSVNNSLSSDLEMFLSNRQAPLRRNSAPVSVSSVRTPLMIKTCQAKAVPVVPPKVQYSQIPPSRQEKDGDTSREPEKEYSKVVAEKSPSAPPQVMPDLREELENKEPTAQKHTVEKSVEAGKTTSPPELPVISRRHAPSLEVFVECPRPSRGNLLQRPSFRNRQRPQSLILLSPPFPIMDYPSSGDDGKILSSIKDAPTVNVRSRELSEGLKMADGIPLQNKMTIPKSGQRLETSTSCFYQPQRRSMIFDSRSHRQIE